MFRLKIKEYRIANRMTQEQLSKASGVSQQFISDLEKSPTHRSKSPTLYTILKISQALKICPALLIHCPHCDNCDKRSKCTDMSCMKYK